MPNLSIANTMHNSFLTSVNEATTKIVLQETMVQHGLMLKRLIATMADNYNPTKLLIFSNLDIKDGFWRMVVSLEDG